jgi:2-keto-4-pentenoate hydratase/2-oxohepta-3-ene-1,7-dioic acid hydratase in catechol pathway
VKDWERNMNQNEPPDPAYTLVTYRAPKGAAAGVVRNGTVFSAAELTGNPAHAAMLGILNDWEATGPMLAKLVAVADRSRGTPIETPQLLAPVLYPSAIFCAGANYSDHAREMADVLERPLEPDPRSLGLKPWHFLKAPRAVIGTGSAVPLPAYSQMVDWEAELAAVIGRAAKNVPVDSALGYVAGYMVANDLSARDFSTRPNVPPTSPFRYDWVSQKSFDASCPIGPWIMPASYVPDPQNLGIKLWVNDILKQDSHTSRMIFSLAEQIAHLSTRITLYPGDLILTGTPAGVGMARREFLKPGDTVRVWIENVGTLTNTIA